MKFDPFTGSRLVCATAANFGMKGPGKLWIFDRSTLNSEFNPTPSTSYNVNEGVYDIAWSEQHPDILAGALADGTVAIFDLNIPKVPTIVYKEHHREVSCVEWSAVTRDRFLSTSYDGTIKIWSVMGGPKGSLMTFGGVQEGHVYQASWSPREAHVILSVGTDRAIRLWDERTPGRPIKIIPNAHENEILSVDWNKWDNMQFATASVDLTIRIWDWRMLSSTLNPMQTLRGHHRAVRKVRWSPWSGTQLFSVGYDMALRCWDLKSVNPMVGVWEGHTEFVTGLDISLHDRRMLLATCAWDQSIHLMRPFHWGSNQGFTI